MDNDIIIKLSAYNLFWDAMKAWGIPDPSIRVLPTASSFIRRDSRIKAQYDQETCTRACHVTDKSDKAKNPGNLEYQQLLSIMEQGEALLISATGAESDFYITTADKRCLKALAASGMTATLSRLEHRIICLEQLVVRLVQQSTDFAKVSRRIIQAAPCEVSVTEAFKLADQAAVIRRLQGEIDLLRSQTGSLLVL
ncbi:MAG: hypothetical protein WBA86_12320 [Nodosilinea sp.]